MTENDAIAVLDGLYGTGGNGGGIFAVAWQILRAKLMESTNSSHNKQSTQCQHDKFDRRQVMDFSFNVCRDCGHQWKC
jgi:ribosomal protein S14